VEASAKDGARNGMVASDYEGVKEVARCEKGDRGRHMAEDTRRKGQKMRYNGLALWREADVERSGTHGKRQVDDEKEVDHADQRGEADG
jgi:hypothetical protein